MQYPTGAVCPANACRVQERLRASLQRQWPGLLLASAAWLSGAAVAAPVAGTDPTELPAITLEQDYAATTVLTIGNTGDATLDYDIRIQEYAPAAVAPSGDGYMTGSSPNDWFPTTDPTLTPQATYSGDHLYFGITEYGEIMPYQ